MQLRQLRAAGQLDTPTLNDRIPDLLEELASALDAPTAGTSFTDD